MQNIQLIGREKEIETLKELLEPGESELVSVIGRLGIGKTELIESVYAERIFFKVIGLENMTVRKQLNQIIKNLTLKLKTEKYAEKRKTWFHAFHLLTIYLRETATDERRVVFFDEMPLLGKDKTEFISAFGYFWNSYALNNNFVVVITGSDSEWIIKKVLRDRGGLYHRVTKRINLSEPPI